MILKNLFWFYFFILVPILLLIVLLKTSYINTIYFAILFIAYTTIYHPCIAGLRLVYSKKISRNKFWYNFIPFWNQRFFSFLFFNS